MPKAPSFVFLVLAVLLLTLTSPTMACGVKSDCALGERIYRIYIPDSASVESRGAIFFAHGWRNSAAGTMSNRSLLELAKALGVALVAPQSVGDDWQLPNRPRARDDTGEIEFQYFSDLVDEVETRFAIDRHRLLMTGFSAGGMLTWSLACYRSTLFAGFAPIAGTFWSPVPDSCPGKPVNLMHFHGTSDDMVPLTGREVADTKQGNVDSALSLFEQSGNFGEAKVVPAEGLDCLRRENADGKLLEFCLHGGGHGYKAAYVRRAWKAFGMDR